MFPEPSPAERQKEKTFGVSSRRSSELRSVVFQSLDLTHGHGNLLGESYWELISPWRGDASTLNTGVSPREENESSLSRILQDNPLKRYYLTKKACLGILRRAAERGKELPEKLKWALEIQAGLVLPDGRPTKLEAYHINQRDEGIDLHGVSGALMATSNMQMPAVELSYIKPKNQRLIAVSIDGEQASPSLAQAKRLRELDKEGKLNGDVIDGILSEQKKEDRGVIISTAELEKYFGKEVTPAKMKEQIMSLLDDWKEKQPPELAKAPKKQELDK